MIFLSNGKQKIKVSADTSLIEAAEELGVPFSCTEGNCGTCLVQVLKGMEEFHAPNDQEEMFGLHDNERLLCQARIKPNIEDNTVIEIKP